MPQVCARCDAALPLVDGEPAPFCPNCGLPQLRVGEAVLEAELARRNGAPVAVTNDMADATAVDWPLLLRTLGVTAVVGVLPCLLLRDLLFGGFAGASVLFLVPVLCLGSGFFYMRRRPMLRMDAGVGARLGLTLGLMLAVLTTTVTAIAGFALRYGRHDRTLQQNMDQLLQQTEAQVRATQPDASAAVVAMFKLPEWHAGMFTLMQGMMMVMLLGVGLVAGTVAGALLKARRQMGQ